MKYESFRIRYELGFVENKEVPEEVPYEMNHEAEDHRGLFRDREA